MAIMHSFPAAAAADPDGQEPGKYTERTKTDEQDRRGDRLTEFSFYLSEDDTERLFAIKELQGLDDLTGNEFARRLLEGELYRQFPAAVKRDEQGSIINADRYRGDRQGK